MKKIFAANWKLNKTPNESREFFKKLDGKELAGFFENRELIFFPQNFSFEAVATTIASSQNLKTVGFGPQNVFSQSSGAFTGENSAVVASGLGAKFILLGHSERRQFFAETNSGLSEKLAFVQQNHLTAVFCVGETLAERDSGKTGFVLDQQLREGLKNAIKANRVVIAYEPVWAIGTGQVATSDQVRETHKMVFNLLSTLGFKDFQILYGGSVKPDNAKELLAIPHVDGFLVGGASLEVDSFLKICQS